MAEKEYIELQKALNVCEMHYEHCLEMHDWSGDATADNIKRDIETIPTADVVEVVRCKDCKHATFYSCKNDACYRGIICEYRIGPDDENFFCGYGERKE